MKKLSLILLVFLSFLLVSCKVNYYKLELPEYVTANVEDISKIANKTEVVLTISLPDNKVFEELKVNDEVVEVLDNQYKFKIAGDTVVKLKSKEKEEFFELTLPEYVSSNITDITKIKKGTSVTLTVELPDNLLLKALMLNDKVVTVTNNKYTFKIDANTVVKITTEDKQVGDVYYKLTLPKYVTANISNLEEVKKDTNVILTVDLPANSKLTEFKVNGDVVTLVDNTYTFKITSNTIIEINFEFIDSGDWAKMSIEESIDYIRNANFDLYRENLINQFAFGTEEFDLSFYTSYTGNLLNDTYFTSKFINDDLVFETLIEQYYTDGKSYYNIEDMKIYDENILTTKSVDIFYPTFDFDVEIPLSISLWNEFSNQFIVNNLEKIINDISNNDLVLNQKGNLVNIKTDGVPLFELIFDVFSEDGLERSDDINATLDVIFEEGKIISAHLLFDFLFYGTPERGYIKFTNDNSIEIPQLDNLDEYELIEEYKIASIYHNNDLLINIKVNDSETFYESLEPFITYLYIEGQQFEGFYLDPEFNVEFDGQYLDENTKLYLKTTKLLTPEERFSELPNYYGFIGKYDENGMIYLDGYILIEEYDYIIIIDTLKNKQYILTEQLEQINKDNHYFNIDQFLRNIGDLDYYLNRYTYHYDDFVVTPVGFNVFTTKFGLKIDEYKSLSDDELISIKPEVKLIISQVQELEDEELNTEEIIEVRLQYGDDVYSKRDFNDAYIYIEYSSGRTFKTIIRDLSSLGFDVIYPTKENQYLSINGIEIPVKVYDISLGQVVIFEKSRIEFFEYLDEITNLTDFDILEPHERVKALKIKYTNTYINNIEHLKELIGQDKVTEVEILTSLFEFDELLDYVDGKYNVLKYYDNNLEVFISIDFVNNIILSEGKYYIQFGKDHFTYISTNLKIVIDYKAFDLIKLNEQISIFDEEEISTNAILLYYALIGKVDVITSKDNYRIEDIFSLDSRELILYLSFINKDGNVNFKKSELLPLDVSYNNKVTISTNLGKIELETNLDEFNLIYSLPNYELKLDDNNNSNLIIFGEANVLNLTATFTENNSVNEAIDNLLSLDSYVLSGSDSKYIYIKGEQIQLYLNNQLRYLIDLKNNQIYLYENNIVYNITGFIGYVDLNEYLSDLSNFIQVGDYLKSLDSKVRISENFEIYIDFSFDSYSEWLTLDEDESANLVDIPTIISDEGYYIIEVQNYNSASIDNLYFYVGNIYEDYGREFSFAEFIEIFETEYVIEGQVCTMNIKINNEIKEFTIILG